MKDNMNETQKEIHEALRLLSVISVSGEAVDVMAAARVRLKEAYRLAGEEGDNG